MDARFETYYRSIFSDLKVDHQESDAIRILFQDANPPPDKLVWLRAAAFRIGTEFLDKAEEDKTALVRAINALVHALEMTCMIPKPTSQSAEQLEASFDEAKVEETYRAFFADLKIDTEESPQLVALFTKDNPPPPSKLVWTRATAFRIGCEFLSDVKENNISLFRAINVVVHIFEHSCMIPKPYELKMEPPKEIAVASIGVDASIEKVVQHLWDLDVNRLKLGTDVVLNVQTGKKPYHKFDGASEPLFTSVHASALKRPTYRTFVALLDNYSAQTGVAEVVTNTERAEIGAFLTAIMETAPMQFCHKYCIANCTSRQVPRDVPGFKKLLHHIWFELYRRTYGGREDSSGFEHVFVGEIKDGQVTGFHNWIRFYLEERAGRVDYRGYVKPKGQADITEDDDYILTLQFLWRGVEKFAGTSFMGVSPEFEMALYTTCFLVGNDSDDNRVKLDTGTDVYDLNIKCYRMARDKVGTSYVEALSHYEE